MLNRINFQERSTADYRRAFKILLCEKRSGKHSGKEMADGYGQCPKKGADGAFG
jgi:hypothetical protein